MRINMESIDVNYVAVLLATVASFVIGGLWYSPMLFAKAWMREMGKSEEEVKRAGGFPVGPMVGGFIATFVTAYVLAHFVYYVGAMTVMDGVQLGFWIWLGFAAMIGLNSIFYEQKSWKYFLITQGYLLLHLVVMAAILAVRS